MNGGSFENALERIEAAVARIERASAAHLERAADRPSQSEQALADRHERLRAAVGQSLRQLDDLIAGQQK